MLVLVVLRKARRRCGGCAVPMPKVDEAVLSTLADQVFAPGRLIDLVSGYLDRAKADAQLHRSQWGQLKSDLTETEGALNRLIGMVEAGLMEVGDPALAERLKTIKAKRAALQSQIVTASAHEPAQKQRLTEAKMNKLSVIIRSALRDQPPEMRKAYLKLFVDNVVISKTEIRVSGPTGVLVKAAMSDLPNTPGEVITIVRAWRPVGDSNPCYRCERVGNCVRYKWLRGPATN
jgi:site-specific DNA recombinase